MRAEVFGYEGEPSFPCPEEQEFLSRANQECFYYLYGLEVCRDNVLSRISKIGRSDETVDFSECKNCADALLNCSTKGKLGLKMEQLGNREKGFFNEFSFCLFGRRGSNDECQGKFNKLLSHLYRSSDSLLK